MKNALDSPAMPLSTIDRSFLIVGFAGLFLLLAVARIAFPRYEWRPVGDGHAVVVYDRWSGRCSAPSGILLAN